MRLVHADMAVRWLIFLPVSAAMVLGLGTVLLTFSIADSDGMALIFAVFLLMGAVLALLALKVHREWAETEERSGGVGDDDLPDYYAEVDRVGLPPRR